jgi:hypothetical protein
VAQRLLPRRASIPLRMQRHYPFETHGHLYTPYRLKAKEIDPATGRLPVRARCHPCPRGGCHWFFFFSFFSFFFCSFCSFCSFFFFFFFPPGGTGRPQSFRLLAWRVCLVAHPAHAPPRGLAARRRGGGGGGAECGGGGCIAADGSPGWGGPTRWCAPAQESEMERVVLARGENFAQVRACALCHLLSRLNSDRKGSQSLSAEGNFLLLWITGRRS